MTVLEDSMVVVATISASRFVGGIRCARACGVCVWGAGGAARHGRAWGRVGLARCQCYQGGTTLHVLCYRYTYRYAITCAARMLRCLVCRAEVERTEKQLRLFSDTLDEWLECQKQWLYLETIFR